MTKKKFELPKDCVVVLHFNWTKKLTSNKMEWCQACSFASQLNKDLKLGLRKIGGSGRYRLRLSGKWLNGKWHHDSYPIIDIYRVETMTSIGATVDKYHIL